MADNSKIGLGQVLRRKGAGFWVGVTLLALLILSPGAFSAKVDKLPTLPKVYHSEDNRLVLLDFYAKWCHTCQTMAPKIEALQQQYSSRLQVIHVDVDKPVNLNLVETYGVYSTPTYVLFTPKGKPVYAMRDTLNANVLRKQVQTQVAKCQNTAKPC